MQALEFRNASDTSSLLTSPMLLYYSFLNLMRAYLAIGPEKISSKSHGLTWEPGKSILETSAKLNKKGTFVEFLNHYGVEISGSTTITLSECLSRIPELKSDSILALQSEVLTINVYVYSDGRVNLNFAVQDENLFRSEWKNWFPELSSICKLASQGTILELNLSRSDKKVGNFLHQHLWDDLRFIDVARWYNLPKNDKFSSWPRLSFYYVAMFILGSSVRYEPDLLLKTISPSSETGWLLNRFVAKAERFFPQLLLRDWTKQRLYF
ncbi:MAG: YaaC family protein [Xenococcus sp. MO_188.B8]|nr:YaaC family protein [Xenococcus sp. MO_188.B8]